MRFQLDPTSPTGLSIEQNKNGTVRTITNAVPRLQTLDDLQDVVVSSTPTDNQSLAYDVATSKWIPKTIAGGGTGGTLKSNKIPTPAPDGIVTTFTLPDASVVAGSASATLNGIEEVITQSANTVTFSHSPISTDLILCGYQVL